VLTATQIHLEGGIRAATQICIVCIWHGKLCDLLLMCIMLLTQWM